MLDIDQNTRTETKIAFSDRRGWIIRQWLFCYNINKQPDTYWARRMQELNDAQANLEYLFYK
jgi:hypothetical protein